MKNFSLLLNFLFVTLLPILTACDSSSQPTLKIAASSVPHAELLEFVKPQLKEKEIDLEIIIVDDYTIPNRSLADREVDANFFQHLPFLEEQIADFGYQLTPLASVHLEPMGIYSKKIKTLEQLQDNSVVTLPSDPSNYKRALQLLQQQGLIQLKDNGSATTLLDITANPLHLKFIEMDAPLLSRTLEDVDVAIINTNFALLAGLSPLKDALAIEGKDSHFANIIVIRKGEEGREDFKALKNALQSPEMHTYILERYQGALLPLF